MLPAILFIGLFATAVFDLWGVLVAKLLGLPLANWKMQGRWFAHLFRGTVKHDSMAAAAPVPGEQALGWIGHYVTGVVFAAVTVAIGGAEWLAVPTLGLPLFVGVVTVGLGWFVMSPGMGGGIAAAKTPNPTRARVLSVIAHVVFGLAMWGAAVIVA